MQRPAPPTLQQLAQQYPGIARYLNNVSYRAHPAGRSKYGNTLEFWGAGESDNFNPRRPAIETWGKVKAADVIGDLVSHYLARGVDPTITRIYHQFVTSLTPAQQRFMREKYANEGSNQPYARWADLNGLPSLFRAGPFHQWPHAESYYTDSQRALLGVLTRYLTSVGIGGSASARTSP